MLGVAARIAVVVGLLGALVAADSPAQPRRAASLYAGAGFDACSAPSLATMQSWLSSSPYRAIGIYIGGVNRACPDGNLSASWTASVVAVGWNLLPLYVGLQAPCVSQPGLVLINPSTASTDGAAAADDAAARATLFGLSQGAPIYFDMEGYKTNSPACTQAVQLFLAGWVSRLRSLGYLAGAYGSAASTIRDLIPSAGGSTGPDAVWIADWNGNTSVFGDPYVPDSYWPSHQRVHQFTGGHNETYAGATINIDSNTVDAPVVGPGTVAPPPPSPPPQPQAGSVTSSDGQATVSWPSNAFTGAATVTASPSALPATVGGFAAGSYVLQLAATNADGSAVTLFAAPVSIVFHTPPAGVVPAFSIDGARWKPATSTPAADGSLTLTTTTPGSIGLLRDVARPTSPGSLTGRFIHGRLLLRWTASSDNSGSIATYEIALDGHPLAAAAGTRPAASVRGFSAHAPTVFRVTAVDAAGNTSAPSAPIVVRPTPRPATIPHQIPNWAFQLAAWQGAGRAGTRPQAPRTVPSWYWRWKAWRQQPFRLAG